MLLAGRCSTAGPGRRGPGPGRGARQSSKTDQHRSLRRRWSSSTRARTGGGRRSRCHRHSRRPPASASAGGSGGPHRLDGVRGRAEVVLGDVRHAGGLPRGVGGEAGCAPQVAGRAHRVPAGGPGPHHRHVAGHPAADGGQGLPGAGVVGADGLEQRQHVLGAVGRPPSASRWWSSSVSVPPRRRVTSRGSRTGGRITGAPSSATGRAPAGPRYRAAGGADRLRHGTLGRWTTCSASAAGSCGRPTRRPSPPGTARSSAGLRGARSEDGEGVSPARTGARRRRGPPGCPPGRPRP